MLEQGQVRLANIADFRQQKYGGQIDDAEEGRIWLREGLASPRRRMIEAEDAYIFCVTSMFLSDTLLWAMQENKETAVLITDPEEFGRRVAIKNPDLTYLGFRPCNYAGRSRVEGPYTDDQLYQMAAWAKPAHYRNQMESRYVWRSQRRDRHDAILDSFEVADLLVPVRYHGLSGFVANETRRIKTVVHLRSGATKGFDVSYPNEVSSPRIFHDAVRGRMLGFVIESRRIGHMRCQGDLVVRSNGVFACVNPLSDVASIGYEF